MAIKNNQHRTRKTECPQCGSIKRLPKVIRVSSDVVDLQCRDCGHNWKSQASWAWKLVTTQ